MSVYIGHYDFLKNIIFHYFAWLLMEGILQWCSWQAGQHTLNQIFVIPHTVYKAVKVTCLITKKLPLHIVLHELWRGFTWFFERSFNDVVDELFQHTLRAYMPSGTFRFVIYTEFLVWIHWFYNLNDILKNMIFHHFALSLVEGILQWCSWRAAPAHPDSNNCFFHLLHL